MRAEASDDAFFGLRFVCEAAPGRSLMLVAAGTEQFLDADWAAAAATASEREQDALALRQGGAAADAVLSNMPASDTPDTRIETNRNDEKDQIPK